MSAHYKTFKTMSSDSNLPEPFINTQQNNVEVPQIYSLDHRKDLISRNFLVVVDNYTDWCGPCKSSAPQYAALAQKYAHPGKCILVKENVDSKFGGQPVPIQGVPCFHFYVNGQFLSDEIIIGANIGQIDKTIQRILSTIN